ncbi:hypothetical protein FQR65_LT20896 [Abscondita terminalis]|nr:hypothetical protein FQR65_LT20896 [Abscondita terminalis]
MSCCAIEKCNHVEEVLQVFCGQGELWRCIARLCATVGNSLRPKGLQCETGFARLHGHALVSDVSETFAESGSARKMSSNLRAATKIFFLRAALAAKELDVVDQQTDQASDSSGLKSSNALTLDCRPAPGSPMAWISGFLRGRRRHYKNQRVVRTAWVIGDLDRRRAGQLVGFTGDETVKCQRPVLYGFGSRRGVDSLAFDGIGSSTLAGTSSDSSGAILADAVGFLGGGQARVQHNWTVDRAFPRIGCRLVMRLANWVLRQSSLLKRFGAAIRSVPSS